MRDQVASPHRSSHREARQGGTPAPVRLRLCLLGGFQLSDGGRRLNVPLGVGRLLAFLALHDGPVSRSHAAGTLWPDTPDERAHANLRSGLWRIRRAGWAIIDATGSDLRLAPSLRTDVHELIAAARRLLRSSSCQEADLDLLHPSAELLPGWYEDWVLVERERLRQMRLHALEILCERLTARGRLGPAVEAGLAAVTEEPLRESARRVLVTAYIAEGNAGEGIRQYEDYRRLLSDELGLEPSPQMEEVIGPLRVR